VLGGQYAVWFLSREERLKGARHVLFVCRKNRRPRFIDADGLVGLPVGLEGQKQREPELVDLGRVGVDAVTHGRELDVVPVDVDIAVGRVAEVRLGEGVSSFFGEKNELTPVNSEPGTEYGVDRIWCQFIFRREK
jgi:hypothetical protein